MHVDLRLELVAVVAVSRGAAPRGAAPIARRQSGAASSADALRQRGDPVAVAGRLAAEGDRAAGPQDAAKLAERAREVGDVVQDGVAEDEVEALVRERQPLGLGDARVSTSTPEPLGAERRARSSIPGEMSVAVARSISPSCSRLSEK